MSALERHHIDVDLAEDGEKNILKLVGRRFDIIVGPLLSVRYEAKELGKASEIKVLYQKVTQGLAFLGMSKHSRKTALLSQFDSVMKQLRQDGTYDAILQRYR